MLMVAYQVVNTCNRSGCFSKQGSNADSITDFSADLADNPAKDLRGINSLADHVVSATIDFI